MKQFLLKHVHEVVTVVAVGTVLSLVSLFNPTALRPGVALAASGGNLSGFAWSETIGWVSFNSSSDGSGTTYGVSVDTTFRNVAGTGAFSGYAWSENIGWINFSGVQINWANGNVTGTAQAVAAPSGGWDGQIKMSDDTVPAWNGHGVKMDLVSGQFSGYAWGGGEGGPVAGVVGWLDFSPNMGGVTGPATGPTVTITADPGTIPSGSSSTLTWSSTGATSCSASAGDWVGGTPSARALSGSESTGNLVTTGGYTYMITCTGPGGSASDTAVVNVVVAGTPDLTAAAPAPASAVINAAQTYTSLISNIGTGDTGAGFSNFFQTATAANGGGTITDRAPAAMAALAASGSAVASSPSITFTSVGTYSIRACADKTSAAGGGVIAESDENNNCSAWTNVSVTSGPAPVVTITANPTSGTAGVVNPTITWSATNTPTSCTASGDWTTNGAKAVSGAESQGILNTVKTYTYTMVCSNANGASAPASATVVVSAGSCANGANNPPLCNACTLPLIWNGVSCVAVPTPTVDLVAAQTTVPIGGSTMLTWTSTNANFCTASGGWSGFKAANGGPTSTGALAAGPHTYTLTCTNLTYGTTGFDTVVVTASNAVCGNGTCEAGETPLSCPADCKTVIEEF